MEKVMRILSTRIHGVMDYGVGLLLIVAPYLFGFADGTAAQYVPQALGAGAILYSLFTRYELGLVRLLPMRAHLALDIASGVFLLLSPWIFGFADALRWPHVILGAIEIVTALMTRTAPDESFQLAHARR
jgi:hypothetical protein